MRRILYEGPSLIDGSPIVALATGPSEGNPKTGPMVQTWILRADQAPADAVRSGADASICGSCRLGPGRPEGTPRVCYVSLGHGPGAAWKAWRRDRYRDATRPGDLRAVGRGLSIRLGAYGDPAAVPIRVWHSLLGAASGWTGYTHQWRDGFALQDLCMASTETDAQADAARAEGWRVFHVTEPDAPRREGFAMCPHHASGGSIQCHTCGLCNGTSGARVSIQHPIHGPTTSGKARRYLPVLREAV